MRKPKATLADLKRKKAPRHAAHTRVRVGMATCGISAGADKVFDAFVEAAREAGLENVDVIPTGCVGRCDLEPMAEVTRGNDPPVLYIELSADKVRRIVREHLVDGNVVEDYAG